MADNDDVADSPGRDVHEAPGTDPHQPDEPVAPAPVLKTRWRDRAWSLRAMIAVGLASLVLGGIGGGAIGAAVDDGNDGHQRMGPGGRGMQGPPGWREHGQRGFGGDGGPGWRRNEGPQQGPGTTPYGVPSQPSPSAPSPSASGSSG